MLTIRQPVSATARPILLAGNSRRSITRMPTVLRSGPYRFFFYAGDGGEPPHVHVERDDCEAKFWLVPVRLAVSQGFKSKEINRLSSLVFEHQAEFLEGWNEFFVG